MIAQPLSIPRRGCFFIHAPLVQQHRGSALARYATKSARLRLSCCCFLFVPWPSPVFVFATATEIISGFSFFLFPPPKIEVSTKNPPPPISQSGCPPLGVFAHISSSPGAVVRGCASSPWWHCPPSPSPLPPIVCCCCRPSCRMGPGPVPDCGSAAAAVHCHPPLLLLSHAGLS